jgi:hypothetical protein
MKPLPPNDLPTAVFSVAEIAAAKRDGYLHIHDNGVLTIHRSGEPVTQVHTPAKDRRRKPLTCSDLCDKIQEGRVSARARHNAMAERPAPRLVKPWPLSTT